MFIKTLPRGILHLSLIGCLALGPQGCRLSDTDSFQGYVDAEYVLVASPLGGPLKELRVDRGQDVLPDDILFSLDDEPQAAARREAARGRDQARAQLEDLKKGLRPSEIAEIEARLDRARANLNYTSSDLKRVENLRSRDFISEDEYRRLESTVIAERKTVNEIEAELETARLGARTDQIIAAEAVLASRKAALTQAEWNLAQQTGRAPARALVFDTLYRPGEYVPPGKPVVSLLPPENLKVRFFVPEGIFSQLSPRMALLVSADGLKEPVEARITYISPQAEYTPPVIFSRERREKLVYMVEGRFSDRDRFPLRPGQPVEVRLAP